MKKNRTVLAFLVGMLIVFSTAALALRFDWINLPGEERTAEQIISLLDAENVTAIEWSGGEVPAFRLERGTDRKWLCPDHADEELDPEKTERTVAALCQVVSARRISDWEDASVYGLDPPNCQVEIALKDGTEIRYQIGNLNPYTNQYYFRLEGESAIHMVGYSVGEPMNYGISDYIK